MKKASLLVASVAAGMLMTMTAFVVLVVAEKQVRNEEDADHTLELPLAFANQ